MIGEYKNILTPLYNRMITSTLMQSHIDCLSGSSVSVITCIVDCSGLNRTAIDSRWCTNTPYSSR